MSIISNTVKKLGPFGLYQLARLLTRKQPKILMYHRFSDDGKAGTVSTDVFERQLQYIKKHFNVKTVTEVGNEVFEKNTPVVNTIAISVDDGYQDFYQYAYPLLKKYNIPATLYVTTGFIENKNWLWPDKISWLLKTVAQPRPEFQFDTIKLSGGHINKEQERKDWGTLIRYLLSVDNDKKENCIKALAEKWQLELPQRAPEEYAPCTLEQLKEMQDNGIEIGGHTVNHPSLGKVTEDVAEAEIIGCQNWLEDNLGDVPRSFCFPNGTSSDYHEVTKVILENKSKFTCAVSAFSDSLGLQHRYAIRRHCGPHEYSNFVSIVSGVELISHKLNKRVLKVES